MGYKSKIDARKNNRLKKLKNEPTILLLMSCCSKKAQKPMKAKWFYRGALFQALRALAETFDFEYLIISAKEGLVRPEQVIEPYDQQVKTNEDVEKLRKIVIPELIEELNIIRPDCVLVVMGRMYRKVVHPLYDNTWVEIRAPGYGMYVSEITRAYKMTWKNFCNTYLLI